MMTWSQENCLIDNHRLTYERWEGDLTDSVCSIGVLCNHDSFPFEGKSLLCWRKVFREFSFMESIAHTFHSTLYTPIAAGLRGGLSRGRFFLSKTGRKMFKILYASVFKFAKTRSAVSVKILKDEREEI